MKLNPNFPDLEGLVHRMGAEPSIWQLPPYLSQKQGKIREGLGTDGIETTLDGLPRGGGLLEYRGEQIVVYIKETRQSRDTLEHDPENARRFHVSECTTLDDMRTNNRYKRYICTTQKDGCFQVFDSDLKEIKAKLYVCKNCLSYLNWKNYNESDYVVKDKLWRKFSLRDFFHSCDTFFRVKPDGTAPPGGYVKNWFSIANRKKIECKWRCEQCGVDLSKHAFLLHVHHKNGVTDDNEPKNLEALCIVCHAAQPYHAGRIRPTEEERRIIEELRRQNGQAT